MLMLGNTDRLASAADLQTALATGLARLLSLATGAVRVDVQGQMPKLDLIQLDLSSAQVDPAVLEKAPVQPVTRQNHLSVKQFHLMAHPLYLASATLTELRIEAREAALEVVTDAQSNRWLRLARADHGRVVMDLGAGELERLVMDAGRHVATQQGIRLEQGRVNLTQIGERAVAFETEATGRKAFFRGTVAVNGEMHFDESLNLQLSHLSCAGHGALGKVAAPWLRSALTRWEGKTFSPLEHTLDAVKCQQARIVIGEGSALRAEAEFVAGPNSPESRVT